MDWFIYNLLPGLIATILVAIMSTIIAIWGRRIKMQGPYILTCIMVIIATGFIIYDHVPDFTPTKYKIRNWLLNAGYSVQITKIPNSEFSYYAEGETGSGISKINISKELDSSFIDLETGIVIDKKHENYLFSVLDEKERKKILKDLEIELFRLDLKIIPIKTEDGSQMIILSLTFVDSPSLTEIDFLQKTLLIYNGTKLILAKIQRLLDYS